MVPPHFRHGAAHTNPWQLWYLIFQIAQWVLVLLYTKLQICILNMGGRTLVQAELELPRDFRLAEIYCYVGQVFCMHKPQAKISDPSRSVSGFHPWILVCVKEKSPLKVLLKTKWVCRIVKCEYPKCAFGSRDIKKADRKLPKVVHTASPGALSLFFATNLQQAFLRQQSMQNPSLRC